MKKLRIYVDTSVIGGCFDQDFCVWSKGLIEDFQAQRFNLVLSDVTSAEIERAPAQVRELYTELIAFAEILPVTDETLDLLEKSMRRMACLVLSFAMICFISHWLPLHRSMC
jgi:hypothetical protein